jgi:carbon storage regulator
LEVGHRGGHRWWIRGKAPVEERCGHKSRRTGLVCTMRTAHKGSHSYGAPAGHEAQSERWFDCSNCDDQGFKILHATVYVELCDECQKNDPPAATRQATAGGSGVQTAPSYPIRLGNTTEEIDMLVLARKLNEAIHIGTSVVRILEIRGNIVRVGIEADREIDILRGELVEHPADVGELVEA